MHYWSVQLVDPFYSAIDFIFHSAAFNGTQACVSPSTARFASSISRCGIPACRTGSIPPAGGRENVLAVAQRQLVPDAFSEASEARRTATAPSAGHAGRERRRAGGGAVEPGSRTTSRAAAGE